MRQKIVKGVVLALVGLVSLAGGVMADPFQSSGFVDPDLGSSWNPSTLQGTASFQLYIDEDWPVVDSVTLEFENDIFDLSSILATDFTVTNPAGWSTSLFASSIGYEFSISQAGTVATSINDPIQITFNYTLLSSDRFNMASGVDWSWDEGQAWGISYTLAEGIFVEGVYYSRHTSSGSTSPVPEPATMLLFGIGLVGFAGVARHKKMQK